MHVQKQSSPDRPYQLSWALGRDVGLVSSGWLQFSSLASKDGHENVPRCAGYMDLPVTMKPYWGFHFSSGTTSSNTNLLFQEKMPLGTGDIWGSPSTWALTH